MPLRHWGQSGAIPLPANLGGHPDRPSVASTTPVRGAPGHGARGWPSIRGRSTVPEGPSSPRIRDRAGPARGAMNGVEEVAAGIACGVFAASAVCDLRSRRVPNAVHVALITLFAVFFLAGGAGPLSRLWVNLAIGAALLAAGFALYLTGGFGAGDGKLIAVAGVWAGPADIGVFLLGVAACAFTLCAIAMLPLDAARRLRRELPFALAIAPPAVVVLIPRALANGT